MICPICCQPVHLSAAVPGFLTEPDWVFWGTAGCRWIVCRNDSFTHFKVQEDGSVTHRLAQIDPEGWDRANFVIDTDENGVLLEKKRKRHAKKV